ncbi:MAG TPA: PQQ-dependent sugar dehydrogenase [Clostridiaceae bacterium]|nr:PQQ-dependent sugar dehydrogenase [Clostridiaceae bacterium]
MGGSDPGNSVETDGQQEGTTSIPEGTSLTPTPAPTAGDLPPVENAAQEADFEPAFVGQTRVNGTVTSTPLAVEIINDDLDSPWAVTPLPDGRLAVTEKGGTLRLVTANGDLSSKIEGFPQVDSRNQGGLLDVAPAPDFSDSRMLYFTLAERTGQGSLTAVGRGRLTEDESRIEDFEIVYRAGPYYDNSMHFGSRLLFDDGGNLFISTGERSDSRTRSRAQELDNGYGKIIHITPDGAPAPGAPFTDGVDADWTEIYSFGHRNVQGIDLHPETGELWVSEMGPRGGDELNLILPGKNYGWPEISYGIEYGGSSVGSGQAVLDGMEQPVYYWDPVIAPSGMTFYDSVEIPEWQNNLFIGGLRGSHIARLVIHENKVIAEERLLAAEGERFRDVTELDGILFAVTDSGLLYRIRKAN